MSDDILSKENILRILTSPSIPQHSLRNELSKFGKISMIEFFPNVQMSIQEVFIKFESKDEAEQALKVLNGTTLDGFCLEITYATNEQAKILYDANLKTHQQIFSQKEEEKSDFKKMEKEMIDDGLDKIINNEFIKEEPETRSIDVEELLDKYPELKEQIANPQIFKGLYDVFKKEYIKKMEQDSSSPEAKRITLSPKQFQEKIKSNKIAKKSGKSPPNPPNRERRISQDSYSRSRSRSKSPGITPIKLFKEEDLDREKKESSSSEKSLQRSSPSRKRFIYSSQMIENKDMNKAFDKNSDYWYLGLKMGIYPDMLPNSQKNLTLNPKSEENDSKEGNI